MQGQREGLDASEGSKAMDNESFGAKLYAMLTTSDSAVCGFCPGARRDLPQ